MSNKKQQHQPQSGPDKPHTTMVFHPGLVGPYPIEAYQFVQEGLSHTVRQIHRNVQAIPLGQRHITGQQLCIGLKNFALHKYGLLARDVLAHWHIQRTDDFGRIVFALIQTGHLSQSDQDRFEDFVGVYAFDDAFDEKRVLAQILNN